MKFRFALLFFPTCLFAQYAPPPNTALRIAFSASADTVSVKKVQDPWLGQDKAKHVIACGLMTLSGQYLLVNSFGASERKALPFSALNAGFWGLMKEVYDKRKSPSKYFSKRDLVADALGIALASTVILASSE